MWYGSIVNSFVQGSTNFPDMGRMVNILGFMGHIPSLLQLLNAVIMHERRNNNKYRNEYDCVLIKLYLTKTGSWI